MSANLFLAVAGIAVGLWYSLSNVTKRVENRIFISKTRREIFEFLADKSKSSHLQPLVYKIVEHKDASGSYRSHDVVEKIPLFGGYTFENTVNVVTNVTSAKDEERIDNKVSGCGLNKWIFSASQSFTFFEQIEEGVEGTLVVDTMEITCPRLLCAGFVAPTAQKAHQRLLQRLKAKMEQEEEEERH